MIMNMSIALIGSLVRLTLSIQFSLGGIVVPPTITYRNCTLNNVKLLQN